MTTIFVAKLDFGVTEEELQSIFGQFGTVAKVNIAKDKDTGKPRGFAFVEMPSESEAQEAISAIDNHSFNGRNCVVKQAEDRSSSKPPSRDGGGFKPRADRPDNRPQRTDFGDRPKFQSEAPPTRPSSDDDDGSSTATPLKQIPKKKLTPTKKVEIDTTNDGKSKKPKMNAYKKSGKDNQFFGDDDDDEELDLFGFSDDDDDDDDYSKYVVNSDDDDDDDDEDYDDDDYEDDDDEEEDY